MKNNNIKIDIYRNTKYPEIQVKLGENQYSRHSHIHQTWSFSYVLHGKTSVSLGPLRSELTKDHYISIPPGLPHLCSPETTSSFSFAVLYVPIEYLNIPTKESLGLRIGNADSAVTSALFDQFIQAMNTMELDLCSRILQKLLNESSHPLRLQRDANLLQKHNQTPLPKGSRFQRYRYTRKLYGLGEKKIATIERMKKAEKLMAQGLDLVEIALKCGFYDQSHFNKVFKLYTGLTPAQYMK